MNEIKIGQKVWVKRVGHRYKTEQSELEPAEVTTVGRKWFTVKGGWWSKERFSLETLLNDGKGYSSSFKIVLDLEQEERDKKRSKMVQDILNYFRYWTGAKLTDEAIEQIHNIIFPQS